MRCSIRVLGVSILLVLLGLGTLTACVDTSAWIKQCNHSLPERGKWTNPLYPGAQNVKNDRGQCCEEVTTTFETADDSKTVLDYYERVLSNAGWRRDTPTVTAYDIHFTIENCCYYGTAAVKATRAGQGSTVVEVYSAWSMGCG